MRKTAISITISPVLLQRLEQFASENRLKVSPAIEFLLQNSLDFLPENEELSKDLKEIDQEIIKKNIKITQLKKQKNKIKEELERKEQKRLDQKTFFESQYETPELAERAIETAKYLEERKQRPKIKFTDEDFKKAKELEEQENANSDTTDQDV
jgi:hypothetical protein